MSDKVRKERFELEVGYDLETNLPRWMTIRLHKKLHSPPDGRPAHVVFDDKGRPCEFLWCQYNQPHRTTGPARLHVNPENGILTYEEYQDLNRPNGTPGEVSWIERNPETGEVLYEHRFDELADSPTPPPALDPK